MKRYIAGLLSLLLLLPATLISCSPSEESPKLEKFSAYSFDYFDTATTVAGYAETREEFDAVANEVFRLLGEYHKLYTIYHRYDGMENLCTINELVDGAHRTVTVDRRILDMLLYAREMHDRTGGRVNIAMGSVLSIWHTYREEGRTDPASAALPPMDQLREAAAHTDIRNMVIDEENCTVTLTDPAMRLDVGAIAKGYAVEMIARHLEEQGITGYVLNVGGNVRTLGVKGDGNPWIVGVENPDQESDEKYLAELALTDYSSVTSGDYQRYYLVDGVRYHHIIDPTTLMPTTAFTSVSVVTPSSADGDALSTALFCMSFEEGLALVESLPDTEVMWLFPNGERKYSSGYTGFFREKS